MHEQEVANKAGRRLMHTRTVECNGFLRDDGLWEVEARLVDTKPYTQPADRYREALKPGDPVHDIQLRLAVDDRMTIHEAQATMQATPYPTCIEVEPVVERLVGENIGKGWREVVRRKIGRVEGCTHLSELLGPAVTTLFQTISSGRDPNGRDTLENQQGLGKQPFFIGGCHSWRTDGPIVADKFPQFASKPAARD
jgi:hypothetical protein